MNKRNIIMSPQKNTKLNNFYIPKRYNKIKNRKDIMSRKQTTYNAEFKAKVVLEVLEGKKSLNEIASKYDLLPKNIAKIIYETEFMEKGER